MKKRKNRTAFKTPVFPAWVVMVSLLLAAGGCKSSGDVKSDPAAVRDIFTGVANVFVLREDGSLWSAGYNRSGQLGSGENPVSSFTEITENGAPFMGVVSVGAGENHTVALKDDGSLWGVGESRYGELGLGGGAEKLAVFTRLKTGGTEGGPITGVRAVTAGSSSTFFIKDDGTLWAAGYNYYGELGLGNRENSTVFTQAASAGNNVKAVAAGARHTVILKTDGTVWAAGYNFNGQLGLDTVEDSAVFAEVKDIGAGAAAVAAGNYHTAVLKTDGTVWTAGGNYYGQLGWSGAGDRRKFAQAVDETGGVLRDVKEIAARGNLTLVLKNDGTVLWAGSYADPRPRDEMNLPPETSQSGEAVPAFALLSAGDAGEPVLSAAKKIVLGSQSIYVAAPDGSLWAAGSNRYGQLNLDSETGGSPVLQRVYP
jgi:alpha-tubulin suppressor-like RCC1 family protein